MAAVNACYIARQSGQTKLEHALSRGLEMDRWRRPITRKL